MPYKAFDDDEGSEDMLRNLSKVVHDTAETDSQLFQSEEVVTTQSLIKQYMKPSTKCFGCRYMFRPPVSPGTDPDMEHLWEFLESNVDTSNLFYICDEVQEKWDDEIWQPAAAADEDIPWWSKELVFIHVIWHINVPKLQCIYMIIKLKAEEEFASQRIFVNGEAHKANAAYLATLRKQIREYMSLLVSLQTNG
jgi:hypothetical protein